MIFHKFKGRGSRGNTHATIEQRAQQDSVGLKENVIRIRGTLGCRYYNYLKLLFKIRVQSLRYIKFFLFSLQGILLDEC